MSMWLISISTTIGSLSHNPNDSSEATQTQESDKMQSKEK